MYARDGSAPVPPPTPRVVCTKDGAVQKQYPSRVGYHGTDKETDLSPEE